ncbi:MAG TPA: 4Fe-4S binding protein [Spirochaetales bacterium]|nr:4Fe-4S binding protein [Spirochaetales bacterium]HRY54619.1 4Fe-4S binding protein [Spirochaetia bacterium]HRZ64438.1 4Fe-4S binding protein [Spirochaetia bacterium]
MSGAAATTIAVASGKGGTGKTTVAAHLALAAAARSRALLVDLDVEAPDALGYFPGAARAGEGASASIQVPVLDEARCSGCGACAKACRFGAIVALGGVVTIDERVCKGCGRCVAACPSRALGERALEVGRVTRRSLGGLELVEGRLAIGDIRSTSVIEAAKREAAASGAEIEVRDCPPGVTCPTVHALAGADYLVLVAEPTEFSLHDLRAAAELASTMGLAAGVVVNKEGFGSADIRAFCASRGLPVIGAIPFSRERASAGARAALWAGDERARAEFERVLDAALAGARKKAAL